MKIKLFSTVTETAVSVENLTKGEFVKLKADAKKVYTYGGYCSTNRKYILNDESDISKWKLVKKGATVIIGFDY